MTWVHDTVPKPCFRTATCTECTQAPQAPPSFPANQMRICERTAPACLKSPPGSPSAHRSEDHSAKATEMGTACRCIVSQRGGKTLTCRRGAPANTSADTGAVSRVRAGAVTAEWQGRKGRGRILTPDWGSLTPKRLKQHLKESSP